MLERALAALESGATLVTPNRRLARTLRHSYNLRQKERGLESWPTAAVLPWGAWLSHLWSALGNNKFLLLSALQEQTLWEQIVLGTHASLLQPAGAARSARDAWNTCQAWRVPIDFETGTDAKAFCAWAKVYVLQCDREHWLDNARLADYLCAHAHELAPYRETVLVGFDELSPQQHELASAMGCSTIAAAGSRPASRLARVARGDTKDEIETAARWSRALLEENASQKIGVVVPALHKHRGTVEKIFDDVFHPASALPGAKSRDRAFNISLGLPLSDFPIIFAALSILDLVGGDASLAQVGKLLRSPFVGGAQAEMSARALLEAKLRDDGELVVCGSWLLKRAESSAPILAERLAAMQRLQVPAAKPASAWPEFFHALLHAAGWPGERTLTSDEYQALVRWDDLLSEFCTLDHVMPLLNYAQALSQLQRVTHETLFQPETIEAPVQILGVLEASGQSFDHLWVMGLDDGAWPRQCSPNPFIPISVQRRFDLPHSTPERELAHAKLALETLVSSADDVVLSWPKSEADIDLAPSRLIENFPLAEAFVLPSYPSYRALVCSAHQTEFFDDDRAPSIAKWTSGGASLFQRQAACAFQAFAAIRLRANPLNDPAPGLSPIERGTLAHAALAAVWDELRTHAALADMKRVESAVAAATRSALADMAKRRRKTFTSAFTALEERRLKRLMFEWLEIDRSREPFECIECEAKKEVAVDGISVGVRIDRTDRLADGSTVVIDYKTGDCDARQWQGARPDAPQLPLYACGASDLAALSFAKVRAGEMQYSGLARRGGIAVGMQVPDNWEATLSDFRRVLQALAHDFLDGVAHVDPKSRETCAQCEFAALCRIAERGARQNEDD